MAANYVSNQDMRRIIAAGGKIWNPLTNAWMTVVGDVPDPTTLPAVPEDLVIAPADAQIVTAIGSSSGGAVTIANGADATDGNTTDTKVQGDTAGTISAKLRGLNTTATALAAQLPAALTGSGNLKSAVVEDSAHDLGAGATTAKTQRMILASDQAAIPVTGGGGGTVDQGAAGADPWPVEGVVFDQLQSSLDRIGSAVMDNGGGTAPRTMQIGGQDDSGNTQPASSTHPLPISGTVWGPDADGAESTQAPVQIGFIETTLSTVQTVTTDVPLPVTQITGYATDGGQGTTNSNLAALVSNSNLFLGNIPGTLLASGVQSATNSNTGPANTGARGVTVWWNISAVPSIVTVTLTIEGQDPVSGGWTTLLTSAARVMTGLTRHLVYPGIAAVANLAVSDVLPYNWRGTITHSAPGNFTYSLGYNFQV